MSRKESRKATLLMRVSERTLERLRAAGAALDMFPHEVAARALDALERELGLSFGTKPKMEDTSSIS